MQTGSAQPSPRANQATEPPASASRHLAAAAIENLTLKICYLALIRKIH
jgi:hypothetical protein